MPGTARAERVLVGITADHEVVAPEGCRLAAPIDDRLVVIGSDRVLCGMVHTEEEAARVLLTDCVQGPVGTSETPKDEVVCCLDYSESGPFTFTASIEILITPSISGGIVNLLELRSWD